MMGSAAVSGAARERGMLDAEGKAEAGGEGTTPLDTSETGDDDDKALPHCAIPLGPTSAVDSFNGLGKHRVLEWHIEEYAVPLGKKKGSKTILKGIAGRAQAGTLCAIMGPSGCGKTSLLDCLALRNRTFTGALRLDGLPLTGAFFLNTGYVHQKELFFHHLTVREHLTFHAITRMSRLRTRQQCQARVEQVMEEVDLVKVADGTIGGGDFYTLKGISGGERKRLNIATELLADPSILLLDEPTSGLDSVMGEIVCLLLRSLAARQPRRIVLTAIHTPSSRVFSLFTHVTLLTSTGELAYWGKRKHLLPFLEGLGYVCPPLFNPADFVLELASAKVLIQGQAGNDSDKQPPSSASAPPPLPAAFARTGSSSSSNGNGGGNGSNGRMSVASLLVPSEAAPKLVEATKARLADQVQLLEPDNCHKQVLGVRGSKSFFWVSFRTNLWRSWLCQKRDNLGIAVGTTMSVALGLVYGVLYYNQIPHDSGRNTLGFVFSVTVTLMISSSIAVCLYLPLDYAIFMREYYAGANTPMAYFIGRSMSSFPNSLHFLLTGIIPYFMTGLAPSAGAFGTFLLAWVLLNYSAQSMGYLASSFSANPIVGLSILPLLITPMILFSGMLYERHSVPTGLEWLQDISLVNYGFALLIINQAEHATKEGVRAFLMSFLQVTSSESTRFFVTLAFLAVAYRWAAMAVICTRVRFISKPT